MHGDWASVDEDGYWFLHGRSDDTLNIAGKRIGPAELESAAVGHPAVREAAAIGVPHEVKGETAWIFCCLLPGAEATRGRASAAHVAGELGKAFKPDRVFFVDALPKTRSAKIVRRAVQATALGTDPGDLSSLENPESLDRSEQQLPDGVALVTGGGRGIGANIARVARRRRLVGRRHGALARPDRRGRGRDRRPRGRDGRRLDASRSSGLRGDRRTSTCSSRTPAVARTTTDWWQTFEVNVLGVHLCCEAAHRRRALAAS